MSFPWIADAHTDFLSRVWHNASILHPNSSDQGQFSLAGLHQGKIGLQDICSVYRQQPTGASCFAVSAPAMRL